jgi:hypothetical protein
MATTIFTDRTLEERVITWAIVMTWPIYLIGGLYILGAVLGWLLLGIALLRLYVEGPGCHHRMPLIIGLWIGGMLMMEISLLAAHAQWSLGLGQTIKSTIGWAKGWALLALFPLLGAILKFRISIISRSCCKVAAQALIFMLITVVIYATGGPDTLFVSPLKAIGGPGPEYFEVRMFGINSESGLPRWFFFAPWAPAAGLVSCLMLPLCLAENDPRWRILGVSGCFIMVLLCQSRAGLPIFMIIVPMSFILRRSFSPWVLLAVATFVPLLILVGLPLIESVLDLYQQVKESRPGSTRVRATLAELALQRWQFEAPIWGHGIVERGPKVVEHMPIGSHHTWYGLLYVKGLIGAVALAIPLLCSLLYLWWQARCSDVATTALTLLIVITLYSFFENVEMLAYLYWPALIWIGYALNPIHTHSSRCAIAVSS